MAHNPYEMMISLSLDGMLDNDEEQELQAHLRNCAACTDLYERMQMLDMMFQQPPQMVPPVNFTANVMNRVERYEAGQNWQPWLIAVLSGASIAAALSIATPILVLTLGLYHMLLDLPLFRSVAALIVQFVDMVQFGINSLSGWLTMLTTDPAALAIVLAALVVASTWIGLLEVLKTNRTVRVSGQHA